MRIRVYILFAVLVVAMIGGIKSAEAAIINGGFETGDFTGWIDTVLPGGSAKVVTSHPSIFPIYYPMEGSYFALLKTDGPGSFTIVEQNIAVSAGDILSGSAAFDARDYSTVNDNAAVEIYDSSASLVNTPWYSDASIVGSFGNGPWTDWSWTATDSDTYTLKYSVANAYDGTYDSYALFDATHHTPIPEPGTFFLLSSGLAGLAGYGKLRFRRKRRLPSASVSS